jgi:hypothetical protein
LLNACGGSQRGADEQWGEPDVEEKGHRVRDTEVLNPIPIEKVVDHRSAFVGVRHDLMLASGAGKAERCSCLAVEVGMPGDALFFWQGDQPRIGGDATVVAIGAQGVACPGGNPIEERRRPSISAIDLENADVVIEVEDLPDGRPLASGAIVPRPGAGGGIFIRPRNQHVIYGRGSSGGRCRVR